MIHLFYKIISSFLLGIASGIGIYDEFRRGVLLIYLNLITLDQFEVFDTNYKVTSTWKKTLSY